MSARRRRARRARDNGSIGRITTAGTITSYPIPTLDTAEITTGPDGALWFTNGNAIWRMTTSGKIATFTPNGFDGAAGIAAGPDSAVWFAGNTNGTIGRIATKLAPTTSGASQPASGRTTFGRA